MSALLLVAPVVATLAPPALAQHKPQTAAKAATPKQMGPKLVGKFDDWTAATHREGDQLVCYAFTRAQNSIPALPGRGDVVLTVTERQSGRDAVAISAGFSYPAGAEVNVQIDQTSHAFYTAQRSAFARDGAMIVAALEKGRTAVARGPGPGKAQIVDNFSLKGFTQAYGAITKACPAGR